MADLPAIRTLEDAARWLDHLEASPRPRALGAWPLGAVLEHLAQSIEMSMDGFPRPRSRLFQQTAGAAAFAVFKMRGRMSHGLDQPIPGAPGLTAAADWKPGAIRLRMALKRFDGYTGELQPHFAYGRLGKNDFAKAHVFHIANHVDEIRLD